MSAEKLLETLFINQTLEDGEQARELFAHLSSDPRSARQFDVFAMAARELEGIEQVGQMSQMELDFHELGFMHALDEQLAQERDREAADPEVAENVIAVDFSHRRLTVQIVALAAVMLATLGVGILLRPADPAQPEIIDEFQARGQEPVTTLATSPQPTLEVFCLTRSPSGEVEVQGKREAAFGVVACPRDGEVQFAYTNPDASWQYAALLGISEHGALLWYGPSPALPGPRRVYPASEPRALGDSIELGVNHAEGTVKTYAIFSPTPIDHVMLSDMVRRHSAKRLYAHSPSARDLPEGAALVALTFDVIEVPE